MSNEVKTTDLVVKPQVDVNNIPPYVYSAAELESMGLVSRRDISVATGWGMDKVHDKLYKHGKDKVPYTIAKLGNKRGDGGYFYNLLTLTHCEEEERQRAIAVLELRTKIFTAYDEFRKKHPNTPYELSAETKALVSQLDNIIATGAVIHAAELAILKNPEREQEIREKAVSKVQEFISPVLQLVYDVKYMDVIERAFWRQEQLAAGADSEAVDKLLLLADDSANMEKVSKKGYIDWIHDNYVSREGIKYILFKWGIKTTMQKQNDSSKAVAAGVIKSGEAYPRFRENDFKAYLVDRGILKKDVVKCRMAKSKTAGWFPEEFFPIEVFEGFYGISFSKMGVVNQLKHLQDEWYVKLNVKLYGEIPADV